MSEVIVQREADEELTAAAIFYEQRESGLGGDFLDELEYWFAQLKEFPSAGGILFDNYRSVFIQRFPFSIVYQIEGDTVYVVAVAHTSRRPGYWLKRK